MGRERDVWDESGSGKQLKYVIKEKDLGDKIRKIKQNAWIDSAGQRHYGEIIEKWTVEK
jgi:hypothetical protein